MGGMEILVGDLNSTNEDVRSEAALVLASAVQRFVDDDNECRFSKSNLATEQILIKLFGIYDLCMWVFYVC